MEEKRFKSKQRPSRYFSTRQKHDITKAYQEALQKNAVKISMDGKGRALDNIYIERFWGSLKREQIYLNPPNGGVDLYIQIKEYVPFYNSQRRHKSLGRITPNEKFYQKIENVS